MMICLNEAKTKGFTLGKDNVLTIPIDFMYNKAIPHTVKKFYSAMVKISIKRGSLQVNENELAYIVEKIEMKINQDLLYILGWLEGHKYITIEGF